MSTEVATTQEAEIEALGASLVDSIDTSKIILPNVKLTQALTREVVDEVVSAGHFFNTLTEEDYGSSVEFVVINRFFGHFYREPGSGDSYSAGEVDVVPDYWPEEYAGKRFVELDDAEERFRELVNAGEREWGKGPPISKTTNFVGLVVGDETGLPVRVSMMRGNSKAAQKIETMLVAGGRSGAPWDRSFILSAERQMSKREEHFYGIKVSRGNPTDEAIRQAAVKYAVDYDRAEKAGEVELAGEEEDVKPKRARRAEGSGGLSMS